MKSKSADSNQLMLSVGALLAAAREKRGIPVERAAKDTRMRPQRIRDMENDDLSHFTNPSYARMFLIAYAKYLDIPMQTIREHLPDRGEPGTEGYQYINTSSEELPSLRRDLSSRNPKRNRLLIGIGIAALAMVIAGVGFIITYAAINGERLMASLNRPPPTEPKSKVVVVETVELSNLEEAEASEAFTGDVELYVPPTPVPVPEMESEATMAEGPTVVPEVEAATTLPDSDVLVDDRAFLLGSSPAETQTPTVP